MKAGGDGRKMEKSRYLVSADWVEKQLGAPEFRIVDASWYMPTNPRNGAVEYASGHIPGAVFFDQDYIADHATGLPHTIPSPEVFATEVEKLGISDTDTIVVYDGPGLAAAPRVWWLFKVMGAQKVFVLDGGMDGWKKQGRAVETDLPEPRPAVFSVRFDHQSVVGIDEMKQIVADRSAQIADARSRGRFLGTDPEPRPGMPSGHMPGARSIPFGELSRDGSLKPLDELRQMMTDAGIDLSRPVVTSCGSGVTAAVITFALHSLGHQDNRLFDGSWSEWASRQDTPIVTGEE